MTAALAAVPVLTWVYFVSLSIYAGNADEFSVAYSTIARFCLPWAVLAIAVLGAPGLLLNEAGLGRYRALLAALGVLTWLQGDILVWDYGALNGSSISWTADAWRGVLDAGIWIVLLAAAARSSERLGKPLAAAAFAVLVIQGIVATLGAIRGPVEPLAQGSAFEATQDTNRIFGFSAESNVVHIVMDGFQTDIFRDILDADESGDLRREFDGFTVFGKNLGAYPYTQLTVPALLTGKLYRNEVPALDFVTRTLRGPTILGAAMDAGYEVDIAAATALANTYGNARHTNLFRIRPGLHVDEDDIALIETARLMDLALFRVVPHFVKALVYRDELWVFQARVHPEEYLHMQYFSDVAFLRQFAQDAAVNRAAPVYKLIHVMLAHQPTVGTASCEFGGRLPTNRATVTGHAGCGLTRVGAVLRRMKELGVYDNSLIVLMADHGAWVPVENLRPADPGADQVSAMTVAMASPLLAIKLPGSRGGLRESDAPTAVTDVPVTIAHALGIDADFPGRPVFDLAPDEHRDRLHAVYGYGDNPGAPGYLFPMHEFHVTGDPLDARNWRRGDSYPPNRVP